MLKQLPISLIVRVNRRTIRRNLRWYVESGGQREDFVNRTLERFRDMPRWNISMDISAEHATRLVFV